MSDFSLPQGSADRDLLFGVLALQLEFIGRDALQGALQAWGANRSRPLGDVLIERDALSPRRRALLDELLVEYLARFDMDPSRGLAAACAARHEQIDLEALTTPALRGNLATLPSAPRTVASVALDGPFPPPPAVGASTSSGKRFRIIRRHARGALGEVFLARDEELNREVALKQIQDRYADHPDSRARFLLEAEITGSLEHPGVVPVYGLGAHADGRPYYAMRFIKGDSLHDAIWRFHEIGRRGGDSSEWTLALRGLLSRFISVCQAIAYAHSRGVVHRDIKPANVMLGPYGETLVVDWGLSKVFDEPVTPDSCEIPIQPLGGGSTTATMLGQAVGTPSFMPPEQAAGRVDEVGPRSDVYSLGATLYNILAGEPPFPGDNADEIIKDVMAHQLVPPRRVKRDIPAALEAIVLKAMSPQPSQRYSSVSELAHEVERWLADEPVKAYPEPAWQRAQRWMRRHRTLVSGLGVLLLTAVVGLGLGLGAVKAQQRKTEAALQRAEENLTLARKAVDDCFLLARDEPLLQDEQHRKLRTLLLKKALPFYQEFKHLKPNDAELQEELGQHLFRVAYINAEIGKAGDAVESYQQARDLFRALVKRDPNNERYLVSLEKTANNLGLLQSESNARKEALASWNEALGVLDRLVAGKNNAEYRADLASTHVNLGNHLREEGKRPEARDHFEQASRIFKELAAGPEGRRYQASLAATYQSLGSLLADDRNGAGALASYQQARLIRERLAKEGPKLPASRIDLAGRLANLGEYLQLQLQKTSARSELADLLTNLGTLHHRQEQPDKALAAYEQALKLWTSLALQYPEMADYQSGLAAAYVGLGVVQLRSGKTEEANKSFERAFEIQSQLVKDHQGDASFKFKQDLATTCLNRGRWFLEKDKPDEAQVWYSRAIAPLRAIVDVNSNLHEDREALRRAYRGRAEAREKLGRHGDAVVDWTEAVKFALDGERDQLRQLRAAALARSGDHAAAMAEVVQLEKSTRVNGELRYGLACVCALAVSAVEKDTALPAGQRVARAAACAEHAMKLLRQAYDDKSFRNNPDSNHIHKDPDLDSLRQRDDFRKLLQKLKK